MAKQSDVAIQHLGMLTVPSTPAQIAAALAFAPDISGSEMEVEGEGLHINTDRPRLGSFVASPGEDAFSLLGGNGASTPKVPKVVLSDDDEDDEDEDEDEEAFNE